VTRIIVSKPRVILQGPCGNPKFPLGIGVRSLQEGGRIAILGACAICKLELVINVEGMDHNG
jgi:hypothetical protein